MFAAPGDSRRMKDTDRRSFLISGVGLSAAAVAKPLAGNAADAGSLSYVQTTAESEARVTPANNNYPSGDVRRYGADPSGRMDSSTAWAQAVACNDHVFDGSPGGGTYLFASEVVIERYPVLISGAVKNIGNGSGGTRITLGAGAGRGKAIFRTKAFASGLRIEKLQFDWQSHDSSQIGFHAGGDLRASSILDCSFVNTIGASNSSVIGIQLDGGEIFTGAVTIRDCYMAGLHIGISLLGHCTTVRIRDNELYGNIPGAARGVNIANKCGGVTLFGNTFEGWATGIYSEGSGVIQLGNYFEGNASASFQWVRGVGNERIWNMSVADIFISGGPPIFPFNNIDACMVLSGPGYASLDNMSLATSRGFNEVGRTQNEGYFATPSFDPRHFTTDGPMRWRVTPQNIETYQASVVGGTISINFVISDSKTEGTGSAALKIAIPGGHKPVARVRTPCVVENGGAPGIGICEVVPGDANVYVYADQTAKASWTPSGRTGASGSITFRIIS
jgi:hypothetical protein